MMKIKTRKIILLPFLYGLIFLCLTLISCERNNNSRGYNYEPDMAYPESYETYAPNPIFPDNKTAQIPPAHTVPRGIIPYPYPKTDEGRQLAGVELINPFKPNAENLERGKLEFNTFCANCHGFDGEGDGNLFSSGKYPSEPPSLVTPEMQSLPDGEFYHVITLGSAIMGSFASLIRQEDKWKIVLYLKNELPDGKLINE